jgi:hypothetical protein
MRDRIDSILLPKLSGIKTRLDLVIIQLVDSM